MDVEKTPDIHLVVSGGAALISRGFISRSTNDVDIFARRAFEGDLISGDPLPDWFVALVARIARMEGLRPDWINSKTSQIFSTLDVIPGKTLQDLEEIEFGHRLRVSMLGREAQIYLKSYTIANRTELRDESDLRALQPSACEIREVAAWMVEQQLMNGAGSDAMIANLNRICYGNE
jgi:hypothetical protein